MKNLRKKISILLIISIFTGLFGTIGASAQTPDYNINLSDIGAYLSEPANTTAQSMKLPGNTPGQIDTKGIVNTQPSLQEQFQKKLEDRFTNLQNKYNKVYPYADIEKPATVQGFDFRLKDNVEFLPETVQFRYRGIEFWESGIPEIATPAPSPSLFGSADLPSPTPGSVNSYHQYMPAMPGVDPETGVVTEPGNGQQFQIGAEILEFENRSFVPEKDKIYIDLNSQSTFKVLQDATPEGQGLKVPVTKPRASDVFEALYIPRQEISLTRGNITDLTEGVELVNLYDPPPVTSYIAYNGAGIPGGDMLTLSELPPADTLRRYHEFSIGEITLFEDPKKPGTKITETEQPKSSGPTPKPTPTPHPEDRDARDAETSSSMGLKIKIKGGKIRVYEPTVVCEIDWDGNFDIGFRALDIDAEMELEMSMSFEKEMCIRLYGYGVDFDSGQVFMGRRVAAHIGIGIYAIIGVNGEITITAIVEQSGAIDGGITGNLWPFLIGVPSAIPYASYDHESFDVAIMLDGKIRAWAYVGPQLTFDVLDFNVLTGQAWLGLEGEATLSAKTGTNTESELNIALRLDFVALFRAWALNYKLEYYLLKLKIFEKTFNFKFGEKVAADSSQKQTIVPILRIDGACAYRDTIWGSMLQRQIDGSYTAVADVPLSLKITRDGKTNTVTVRTDSEGKFVYKPGAGLLPTDSITAEVNYTFTNDAGQEITYAASLTEPVNPTIPFTPTILEADGFNNVVSGTVSPAAPIPGFPDEEEYTGEVHITVYNEDGTPRRRKTAEVADGKFYVRFEETMDLSGGKTVKAVVNVENGSVASDTVKVNLDALDMNIYCEVDGIDALTIVDLFAGKRNTLAGNMGISAKEIKAEGTITNRRGWSPFEGSIKMSIGFMNSGLAYEFPLEVYPRTSNDLFGSLILPEPVYIASLGSPSITMPGGKPGGSNLFEGPDPEELENQLHGNLHPYSTFSGEVPYADMGEYGRLIGRITFEIEHEGMIKYVNYQFASTDDPEIVAGPGNPVEEKLSGEIDSVVNPPVVSLTQGHSQMTVRGVSRAIDGRSNTSVMEVNGQVYVPAEAVIQALGGTVEYGATTKQHMRINLNQNSVEWKGGSQITVNGKAFNLDAAPFKEGSGTIMFPASFLTNLGLTVEWNKDTKSLSIWMGDATAEQSVNQGIQNAPVPQGSAGLPWTGVWDTNLGPMLLTQNGETVTGTFGEWEDNFEIKGTVKGDTLSGTYKTDWETGTFSFKMLPKGLFEGEFEGTYRADDSEKWEPSYEWSGTKISDSFGTVGTTWGGTWYTDIGPMILYQEGNKVTGIYRAYLQEELSTIEGTISGSTLRCEFLECNEYKGTAEFTLSKDGKSFKGLIRYGDDGEWGTWDGAKKK